MPAALTEVSAPGSFPAIDYADLPSLTTDQMREVDRAMVQDYGINLVQMMENAGRNLAHLARTRFLGGNPQGRKVLVLAGTGGNGGGGMACARRLHNWGAEVKVIATAPASAYQGVPRNQLDTLVRIGVPVNHALESEDVPEADLIVDAIIGYSLRGAPTGAAASLIREANAQEAPVLSLDVPSGVDTSSGIVLEPAIRANATLTLALPKTGLHAPTAIPYVGELYVADISVPPELYARPTLGLNVGPVFSRDDIVRLR